jgi:hypothetical protein
MCGAPEGCDCNHFRKAPAVHDGLSMDGVHWHKARQDAEWLAGSEADTAERNLARAYLALNEQVATLTEQVDNAVRIGTEYRKWWKSAERMEGKARAELAALRAPVPSGVTEAMVEAALRERLAIHRERYAGGGVSAKVQGMDQTRGEMFRVLTAALRGTEG